MHPRVILLAVTALVAMVAAVLWLHGTGEEGLHAVIRATARTSALCVGLAFARIRVREASALLPVSHALHYAFIIAAGVLATRDWTSVAVGVVIYAVMVWNAARPNATAIYILWIAFLVAFLRPGAIYVMIIGLLLLCGVLRWFPRARATIA